MKRLLTGNEAIARGAWEAGIRFASAYPGTPSTEITENLAGYEEVHAEWAPNEKVALESGIGAALGGVRALVSMKHVGLNVASDPFCTLSYIGVNAGIVVVSADDPSMHSSQNEQDNRYYAKLAKVPMLEPADSQEARDFVKLAFEISEKFDTPVLFRVTTRISHSRGLVEPGRRKKIRPKTFARDPVKYVMVPAFGRIRHRAVVERTEKLKKHSESIPINLIEKGEKSLGIITSGVAYQYAKEVFPAASVLKLGMTHPLPEKLIKKFARTVDKIIVIEELEPYLEDAAKTLGVKAAGKDRLPVTGELNPDIVRAAFVRKRRPHPVEDASSLPPRPPNLCAGCPHRGAFAAMRPLKPVVFGDIGCYTLSVMPPLSTHDVVICMGASIGMSYGFGKAGVQDKKCVGVIGDSTFLHAGLTGIMQMAYNRGVNTVIVLDNRTTAMTGGQDHPGTGRTLEGEPTAAVDIARVCKALGVRRVFRCDPFKVKETRKLIKQEINTGEPSVIIAGAPCPLMARKKPGPPARVDPELCNECGVCLQINCPAMTRDGDRARVVPSLCRGCGVCEQLCGHRAISRGKKGK